MNDTDRVIYEDGAMTLAEVQGLFEADDLMEIEREKVYKLSTPEGRFHFTFDRSSYEPRFYESVTSFVSKTLPTPYHLLKWYADNGLEEVQKKQKESKEYGTLMHVLFAELLINGYVDLDGIKERATATIENAGLRVDPFYWAEALKKDCIAFHQFCHDYFVEPWGIENMLVNKELGISGAVDLPCKMYDKQYTDATPESKRKRVNAIVDFKSGRKGFYESNEIQLEAYKQIWEYNFPDIPIERLYNFAPSDWRKGPSYKLQNQTDKPSREKLPYMIEMAKIDHVEPDAKFKVTKGELALDQSNENNYETLSLAYVAKKRLV